MILFLYTILIPNEKLYISISVELRRFISLPKKIGIDKIRYIITYIANSIAKLSDSQIQTIVNYFFKNPNTELLNDQESTIINSEEKISGNQNNVLGVQVNL